MVVAAVAVVPPEAEHDPSLVESKPGPLELGEGSRSRRIDDLVEHDLAGVDVEPDEMMRCAARVRSPRPPRRRSPCVRCR